MKIFKVVVILEKEAKKDKKNGVQINQDQNMIVEQLKTEIHACKKIVIKIDGIIKKVEEAII